MDSAGVIVIDCDQEGCLRDHGPDFVEFGGASSRISIDLDMNSVRQMTYQPGGDPWAPVEVMTFDRLGELNRGQTQRGDFHVIALVAGGVGSVTVDFVAYPLMQRTAVWIAPGSVHAWTDIATLQGTVVLFTPTTPVTPATRELVSAPDLVATWVADASEWPLIVAALEHLRLEAGAVHAIASSQILSILVSALIVRLNPPHVLARSKNPLFDLFHISLEKNFYEHHDVGFYARTLGYDPRTLSRACQDETGRTAKALITERVLLESKRLLAHEQLNVTQCARALGFVDASAFSAFFLRMAGARPGLWQARERDVSEGSRLGPAVGSG